MTFSKPLLATDTENIKMNWWQYLFGHCWMTGWQTISSAFRIWADLMCSNYEVYALPRTAQDPEVECIEWFWATLGEDEVLPKSFLEYLMEMAEDVRTGRVELSPLDDDFFDRLEDLTDDVELDD